MFFLCFFESEIILKLSCFLQDISTIFSCEIKINIGTSFSKKECAFLYQSSFRSNRSL